MSDRIVEIIITEHPSKRVTVIHDTMDNIGEVIEKYARMVYNINSYRGEVQVSFEYVADGIDFYCPIGSFGDTNNPDELSISWCYPIMQAMSASDTLRYLREEVWTEDNGYDIGEV